MMLTEEKMQAKPNESFFTFNHIHKNVMGIPIYEKVNELQTLEEQSKYVVDFMKSITNIDVIDYLRKNFTLDYIVLNEDRHFNNLGIIMDDKGEYRTAPIFDHGKSLLNGNFSIKDNLPICDNVKRVVCRPFGGTHQKLLAFYGTGFAIDVEKARAWVEEQTPSYQREVLLYQLKNY